MRGRVDRVDLKRSGDELLIRITDYKTGVFKSPRGSAESGIGMQLLLYLCSLCSDSDRVKKLLSDGEAAARKLLGNSAEPPENIESLPSKIVPAGAIYMSVRTPEVSADAPAEDSESAEAGRARRAAPRRSDIR